MTANPDSALRQALVAAEKGLKRAIETIRNWNGMGIPKQTEPQVWAAYQSSPEMKQINEAHALITEALQRGEKNG